MTSPPQPSIAGAAGDGAAVVVVAHAFWAPFLTSSARDRPVGPPPCMNLRETASRDLAYRIALAAAGTLLAMRIEAGLGWAGRLAFCRFFGVRESSRWRWNFVFFFCEDGVMRG